MPDILDPRTRIVDKLPPPSTWLNYGGPGPAIGSVVGPNTLGEYLTVVYSERDPAASRTRVGLAFGVYIIPVDVPSLPTADGAS